MNESSMTALMVSALIVGGSLSAGLILLLRSLSFARNSLSATGTVVALRKRGTTKSGRPMYSPVVRFDAADGRTVEFTEFIKRHPAGFEVGQRVEVLYDSRNFQRARAVKSRLDLYFPAWVFLLVGGVLLLALVLLLAVMLAAALLLGGPKAG